MGLFYLLLLRDDKRYFVLQNSENECDFAWPSHLSTSYYISLKRGTNPASEVYCCISAYYFSSRINFIMWPGVA